jgi:translation initiation factor IF-1
MSGAGRKHRAKQLTADFLDETWDATLADDEEVAVVKSASSGGKQLTVEFPGIGDLAHIQIPGKFNKVVWLLRNDVVIVASRAILVRKLTNPQLSTLAEKDPAAAALQAMREEEKVTKSSLDDILENPNRVRYGSRRRMTYDEEEEEEEGEEGEVEEEEGEEGQKEEDGQTSDVKAASGVPPHK